MKASPEPAYRPEDVPRLRRELIGWHRVYGEVFQREMIAQGRQGLAPPGAPVAVAAAVLIGEELERLEDAELFYAGPDVVDLVSAAAPSMPLFAPKPWDFPAPAGMILFGKPLASRDIDDYEKELTRQYFPAGDDTPDRQKARIVAAVWGPWTATTAHPAWLTGSPIRSHHWDAGGGVWLSFYAAPVYLTDFMPGASAADRARNRQLTAPLNPEDEAAFAFLPDPGFIPPGWTPDDYVLKEKGDGGITAWVRATLAVLQLMRQEKITAVTAAHVRSTEAKRHARAGITPPKAVHLVTLRGRARAKAGKHPGDSGRTLTKRFPVGPFWRNQWYPRDQVHRPILIAQFVKGPQDAPFTGAERVRIITAPAQPPEQP